MAHFEDALYGFLGELQAFGVDIHQADRTVLEKRESQDVAYQAARELQASGSDEGDFWH
jgi:hypothetical protein